MRLRFTPRYGGNDADAAALDAWVSYWVEAHRAMWSKGPQVDPRVFVQVENAVQVMRSLHAALSMDATPTPTGAACSQDAGRRTREDAVTGA